MRSTDDWPLSLITVGVAGLIGWNVLAPRARVPAPPPRAPRAIDARVDAIAQAIAVAEGYYAKGMHDGRSLPFRLNNPGALKKPALGARALPTWKDTGIVHFPTKEMGWAALRHQVRGILTGASRIYRPSDTVALVGEKYAEGDVNWGLNVAAMLGVPPTAPIEDLPPPFR
jgi:hypothetical protein